MSTLAELYFHTVYEADASAASTVKVLGQTPGDAVSSDQTIVVHVTVAALKDALKFNPGWTVPANNVLDADTLPTVTWDPRKLEVAMKETATKTAEDRFLEKYPSEGTTAQFSDDAATLVDAMQKVISQCDPASESLIEKIPFEAIIKVTADGVESDKLAEILPISTNTDDHDSDIMNLFEQALAAGKASEQTSGATGVLDFVEGDSITVYVKYSVHKKTTVDLDAVQGSGSAAFKLPDGTAITDGLEETGPSKDYTVAWKFLASV